MKSTPVISIVALIVFCLVLSYGYVRYTQAATRATLEAHIGEVELTLRETAENLKNNTEDELVATYVTDCSNRTRTQFDMHLDTLASLSTAELEQTELLFEACADYFAHKKRAEVEKLRMELRSYEHLVDTYDVIAPTANRVWQLEDWHLFLSFQEQLAALLEAQVPIQQEIIILLKSGVPEGDPAIKSQVEAAQEITQTATVTTRQMSSVYTRLSQ
ncbi:MAG: hypothetical protein R3B69_00500 [Candidatus Paceibacterota bacterium]